MRSILTTIALFFCCLFASAGIVPSENAEYCPIVEHLFDVDYPGNQSFCCFDASTNTGGRYISRSYNSSTDVTTFKFGFTFNDIAAAHDITINYYSGTTHQAQTIPFKYIKSVYGDTRQVSPGIYTITAPFCVTTTTNISFSNLSWKSGSVTFGTNYEYDYSVPAGWSVNGSVSSGQSDIKHGGNTATIVSDGVTGGYVSITPVNRACGITTLSGTPYVIGIVRAEPSLTFSGSSSICSAENYSASGIPSWVTDVLWEFTSSSLVTSGSSTSNPATFTKSTDGVGTMKFTISNSGCGLSREFNTSQITGGSSDIVVGSPKPSALYKEYEYCIGGSDWEATFRAYPNSGNFTYNWKYNGSLDTYNHNSSYYIYEFPADCVTLDVQLVSSCGASTWLSADYSGYPATFCPSCFGYRMSMTPNPTSNQITITSKSVKNPLNIKEVRVVDGQGVVRKSVKASSVRQLKIDISTLPAGKYFVNVFDGKEWLSQVIIKN